MSAGSQAIVLTLMLGGIVVGVVGMCVTAVGRRPDLTLPALLWAGSDLAAHPERYVMPRLLGAVRVLNLLSVGLFSAGALTLAFHAVARLL